MSRQLAVQVFSVLAIVVGLAVSYYPPPINADAIWALVGGFLGYAARDLFTVEGVQIGTFVGARGPELGGRQGGRALPGLLALLAVASAALHAGCASLQNAGTAEYSVRPITTADGALACCEVQVRNGKEIAYLKARIEKEGERYVVDLEEHGVQAFAGQAIAAGAQQALIEQAAKTAAAAALAPVLPALIPAAGAALASPGIGAAAVGVAAGAGAASMMAAPPAGDGGPGLRVPR